jgi:hypothetical protein
MRVILVAGALANKLGNGGETWVRMSWVVGLRRLGFDVYFVEQFAHESCVDAAGAVTSFADSVNLAWFKSVTEWFGVADRSALIYVGEKGGEKGVGYLLPERPEGGEKGVGYLLPERPEGCLAQKVPDPFFAARFTTVASWRGAFGPVQVGGRTFGLKVHEFRKFLELPQRVPATFEIALDIHPADQKDRAALEQHGWLLVDPREVAGDAAVFRCYVQESGAEFSVAQGIYVDTNSGWFSDRSVRYLASGKPVLVQDTGFGRHLPVGKGLVSFRTLDEAVRGTEAIATDYEGHCQAARELAGQYFDSDKVLSQMLEEIGIAT